jgi:hypothetical protein
MTVPIPDRDNIPPLGELEARRDHAEAMRHDNPAVNDTEILAAWDSLAGFDRLLRIADGWRAITERVAR